MDIKAKTVSFVTVWIILNIVMDGTVLYTQKKIIKLKEDHDVERLMESYENC